MEIPIIRLGHTSFYQIMIIIAIFLGGIYLMLQKRYTIRQKIIAIITTIISGLVGARVFYLIVNYKTATISQAFSTSFTYFKGFGALIFALINIVILSMINKSKLSEAFNPLVMWFYIGGMLAKIGCFFTGCCKGGPTSLPWGVYRKYDVVKVHPSELYDCGAFLFSLIIWWILKKEKMRDSNRIAISLMIYVILRGIIESTYYNGILFGDVISRIVYGIVIVICLSVIIKNAFDYKLNRQKNLNIENSYDK